MYVEVCICIYHSTTFNVLINDVHDWNKNSCTHSFKHCEFLQLQCFFFLVGVPLFISTTGFLKQKKDKQNNFFCALHTSAVLALFLQGQMEVYSHMDTKMNCKKLLTCHIRHIPVKTKQNWDGHNTCDYFGTHCFNEEKEKL